MKNSHNVLRLGPPLEQARGALVMLHGRGSSAEEIVRLLSVLEASDYAVLAPDAEHGAWYPQRFLAPIQMNEPYLSEALATVQAQVDSAREAGLSTEQIGFIGFSQGACLSLEYVARNPARYGFVAGLSGALIGPLDTPRVSQNLMKTPILLGCAERDGHIPLEHVEASASLLDQMDADVTKLIYPGSAHTVFPTEVDWINQRLTKR